MRLPFASELDSRNGVTNKDSRLTNALMERDEATTYAAVRPGLSTIATYSGAGNGLSVLGGQLIRVYGNTLTVDAGSFDITTGVFTPA